MHLPTKLPTYISEIKHAIWKVRDCNSLLASDGQDARKLYESYEMNEMLLNCLDIRVSFYSNPE